MESKTEQLAESGAFEKYREIHKSYLDLLFQTDNEEAKLEILKRLIFLNWYSLLEPSCFTGVEDLDGSIIFDSYSILNDYLANSKIDAEFKWMLSYYSCWDYTILAFSENKLGALTKFVKEVDTSILHAPKKQLPKGTMSNRGQMGIYWISCGI
ncbi:hypothetical protein [Pedobacter nyackensis]|uniref:Uncharacterized protein n=1 Tax=Pedobacter nyackensis TaxID=475255 RepID=A0A1W2DYF7_9SPHI|nr:hypothetical protein [Pedobacter nyackensis]SMD01878.1 hypothetical protein SAMN04488101_108227 [Pedobacter nyackensis]